jgi:hypothetical protein
MAGCQTRIGASGMASVNRRRGHVAGRMSSNVLEWGHDRRRC